MKYDVIIVGAGPAGLFCAYELISKNKVKISLKIQIKLGQYGQVLFVVCKS